MECLQPKQSTEKEREKGDKPWYEEEEEGEEEEVVVGEGEVKLGRGGVAVGVPEKIYKKEDIEAAEYTNSEQ